MFRKKQGAIVHIQGKVTWRVAHDERTSMYLGICDALNLNASGDTWGEFTAAANEAIALLFQDLLEDSEFEAFLRDRGFTQFGPTPIKGQTPRFDVPWNVEHADKVSSLA